jgi:hypothetical protein
MKMASTSQAAAALVESSKHFGPHRAKVADVTKPNGIGKCERPF